MGFFIRISGNSYKEDCNNPFFLLNPSNIIDLTNTESDLHTDGVLAQTSPGKSKLMAKVNKRENCYS